jgi:hypothetical protein
MSGPGSFAAIYTMRIDHRDTPVAVAVTFPARETRKTSEHQFRQVALRDGWEGVATAKWSVYVPNVVMHYPPGSRVTILDDRVISGETQAIVKRMLELRDLEVQCAALFGPRECEVPDILVGRYIEGEFEMPWGTSRGRT